MCSIEFIEYASTLFEVNNVRSSLMECDSRYFRSFDAHNSTRSNPASPAARISVSRFACIVVAPFNASFIKSLPSGKNKGQFITQGLNSLALAKAAFSVSFRGVTPIGYPGNEKRFKFVSESAKLQ